MTPETRLTILVELRIRLAYVGRELSAAIDAEDADGVLHWSDRRDAIRSALQYMEARKA